LVHTSGSKFSNFSKIKESLVSVVFEEIQNLGTAHCSSGLFWDFQNKKKNLRFEVFFINFLVKNSKELIL
jgi:hypothetical protein